MRTFVSRVMTHSFAILLSVGLVLPAAAQAHSAALERERQAVFTQLLAAPADPDLMLQYARLSVELRDFESAAATLERYVDLNPENAAARVELGLAYLALGANEIADYHLSAAQSSGGLSPEQSGQVEGYRSEVESRSARSQFQGRIVAGAAYVESADEARPIGTAILQWRYDMGGANANEWVTDLGFAAFLPGETSFDDRQIARLRTGPEFRLNGASNGPRLRPYLQLEAFRDDSFILGNNNSVAFGVAYQNSHNARWGSFADVQIGHASATDGGTDFDFREGVAGAIFRPSQATRLRGSLRWRVEEGSQVELAVQGARLEVLHRFEPGFVSVARPWEARGFLDYAEIEETVAGVTEDLTDTAYGAALRSFVTDDVFLELRATRLRREEAGSTTDESVYSLQVGWEF